MSDLLSGLTHGNGLVTEALYDQDYRLQGLSLRDGPSFISNFTYPYADNLNLTGITDQVTPANSVSLAYSPANRLINADGPWGQKSLSYDGVGNRTSETSVVSGASSVRDLLYSLSNNRVNGVNENGAALRTYSYDGAGNTATETRPGERFTYGYNNRNRLTTVTRNGVAYASYGYNADEQMTSRSKSAIGGPTGVVHYVYDLDGHLIAEADGSTGVTLREYLWLPANDNRNADPAGPPGEGLNLEKQVLKRTKLNSPVHCEFDSGFGFCRSRRNSLSLADVARVLPCRLAAGFALKHRPHIPSLRFRPAGDSKAGLCAGALRREWNYTIPRYC
jgi:YD repeat-containing protein